MGLPCGAWASEESLSGKGLELTSEEMQLPSETLQEAYSKRGEISCFLSAADFAFPPASPSGHIYLEASWQEHLEDAIPSAPSRAVGGVRDDRKNPGTASHWPCEPLKLPQSNFQAMPFDLLLKSIWKYFNNLTRDVLICLLLFSHQVMSALCDPMDYSPPGFFYPNLIG